MYCRGGKGEFKELRDFPDFLNAESALGVRRRGSNTVQPKDVRSALCVRNVQANAANASRLDRRRLACPVQGIHQLTAVSISGVTLSQCGAKCTPIGFLSIYNRYTVYTSYRRASAHTSNKAAATGTKV
eukprot:363469-Chlamydomonas_euryale.AAC.5